MIFSPKVPSTLPCACVEYFKPACLNAHLILCGMLEQRRASAQEQERIRGRPEKFSRDFTLSLSKGFTLKAAGCQIFFCCCCCWSWFLVVCLFYCFSDSASLCNSPAEFSSHTSHDSFVCPLFETGPLCAAQVGLEFVVIFSFTQPPGCQNYKSAPLLPALDTWSDQS